MLKTLSLFLLISSFCRSQTPSLSCYEKRWALLHPVAALKVNRIGKQAAKLYNDPALKSRLDAYASGGRLDAFRHTFYMAAFAQKVKAKKLRKLGMAHEKANYRQFLKALTEEGEVPDSLSSVMDLQNNELGIRTGDEHKKLSLEDLKALVIKAITEGQAVILKRSKSGAYLDCNGRELSLQARQWNIPKCLVPSSYVYRD